MNLYGLGRVLTSGVAVRCACDFTFLPVTVCLFSPLLPLAQMAGLRVLIRAGVSDVPLPAGDFAVHFTHKARCGKHPVRSWPH